jgi:DNA-binding NarL/FixJ family response regulator
MNGLELAIRLLEGRPSLRVLCMSGYTDDHALLNTVAERGVPYIQKPVRPETITRRVRQVLDGPPVAARRD